MFKGSKATANQRKRDTKGEHGGNRAGGRARRDAQPKQSSQAAGKDPQRGTGKS